MKKTSRIFAAGITAGLFFLGGLLDSHAEQATPSGPPRPIVEANGTVHVPAFDLPLSIYVSDAARRLFITANTPPPPIDASHGIDKFRETLDRYYFGPQLALAKERYAVDIVARRIDGIRVDVVTPKSGIATRNRDRVLINLHGGGMLAGAGTGGLVESVPIADVGKIKVVSVDYRMAPEYTFPAASEDVATVYKALLRQYPPANIGIYGCSSGGNLTAQAVAWLQKEQLPAPGAIGIFCAGAAQLNGDSVYISPLSPGHPPPPGQGRVWTYPEAWKYEAKTDPKEPLLAPAFWPQVLQKFPPTLLITSTRDAELSDAVFTHTQLVKAGVDAQLNVWEGMTHGFIGHVDLPEAREAFAVTVRFFDSHLGTTPAPGAQ